MVTDADGTGWPFSSLGRCSLINLVRLFLVAALGAAIGMAGNTGKISGSIVGQDGKPIDGAFVTYTRAGIKAGETTALADGYLTTDDGKFSFSALPAGTYLLCVQTSPHRLYIDICEWILTPPKVILADGQQVDNVKIMLPKGARVEFQFKDPNKVLPAVGRASAKATLRAGLVTADGIFHSLRYHWQDDQSQMHALVVPFSSAMQVHVSGNAVQFSNGQGRALANNGRDTVFQMDPGTDVRHFDFQTNSVKSDTP